jgi:hypothetical protein
VVNGGTGATTLTGLVKGNGTGTMTAAVAGTDYLAPNGSAVNLTNFPTLNQNTTGTAASASTATTTTNIAGGLGGTIPYQSAANTTAMLANGSSGQVLTSQGTTLAPVWAAASSGGVHTIGEPYGGGKVFYLYDGGKHGLIAAIADQGTGIRWYGGSYTNTRARGDGVGAGLKNTAIIIANQGSFDGNPFAATVCNEYSVTETVGGIATTYGDWYLPSRHELDLLYLQKSLVGGVWGMYYWSSTEIDDITAYCKNFAAGGAFRYYKNNGTNVRAIRAF